MGTTAPETYAPMTYNQLQTEMLDRIVHGAMQKAAKYGGTGVPVAADEVRDSAEMFVRIPGSENLHWVVGVEIDEQGDLILITDGGSEFNRNR